MGERVQFVDKEQIYPAFGRALTSKKIVYVRRDLIKCARDFVVQHELQHLEHSYESWIWEEITANLYALTKHPIGGLIIIIMSLAPYRLKHYWNRIKRGD